MMDTSSSSLSSASSPSSSTSLQDSVGYYPRRHLAQIRVKKDVQELATQRLSYDFASTAVEFPEGSKNLLKIKVVVTMSGGIYRGGSFTFILDVPQTYPFHAPQIRCLTRTWHPNIHPNTGSVLLPIVRADWRPVLNINTVVYGLQLLFVEPNIDSACNLVAAQTLSENPAVFENQVRQTLAGGTFHGIVFEPNQHGSTARSSRQLMKRKSSSMEALCELDSMRLDDGSSAMGAECAGSGSRGDDGRGGSGCIVDGGGGSCDGGGGDVENDGNDHGSHDHDQDDDVVVAVGGLGGGPAGRRGDSPHYSRSSRYKRSCGMNARLSPFAVAAAAAAAPPPLPPPPDDFVVGGASADGGAGVDSMDPEESSYLGSSLLSSSAGGGALAARPCQATQQCALFSPPHPHHAKSFGDGSSNHLHQHQHQHHHPPQECSSFTEAAATVSTPPVVSSPVQSMRPHAGFSGGAQAWQPGQHQNHHLHHQSPQQFSPHQVQWQQQQQQQQQQNLYPQHSFIKTFTSSHDIAPPPASSSMQDEPQAMPHPPGSWQPHKTFEKAAAAASNNPFNFFQHGAHS